MLVWCRRLVWHRVVWCVGYADEVMRVGGARLLAASPPRERASSPPLRSEPPRLLARQTCAKRAPNVGTYPDSGDVSLVAWLLVAWLLAYQHTPHACIGPHSKHCPQEQIATTLHIPSLYSIYSPILDIVAWLVLGVGREVLASDTARGGASGYSYSPPPSRTAPSGRRQAAGLRQARAGRRRNPLAH